MNLKYIFISLACIIILIVINLLIFISLKKRNNNIHKQNHQSAIHKNNNYKNCSKARQIIENSNNTSNYFRENDDVYGKCKFAHSICQLNAKCTKKQSFVSGCLATGIDKYGRITDFGCPAKCCNYNS